MRFNQGTMGGPRLPGGAGTRASSNQVSCVDWPTQILGKKASGVYEDWIAKRFLKEHNKCPGAADHMTSLDHIRIYAEDILIMNEASKKHQVRLACVFSVPAWYWCPDGVGRYSAVGTNGFTPVV